MLRRSESSLRHGDWRVLGTKRGALAYERVANGARNVVVINVGGDPERLAGLDVSTLLWSAGEVAIDGSQVVVAADSGAVLA